MVTLLNRECFKYPSALESQGALASGLVLLRDWGHVLLWHDSLPTLLLFYLPPPYDALL